ncbi:iron complex outermembrane receptor protein [Duganella sp. SG902]|uniref:TonB-dependent receptor domain-containing protein n=1 Tax=Duganella sp. SG902 TaxID=2587016 RepID=UPI00183C1253|nr:TonB-dependent receptor [Duganella sp. SG902]NVM76431.1 iron complex outermembrane receptor protein [Duganella sp. SG902]
MARSVRIICAGGLALGMTAAMAQQASDDVVARVEITGSSIKRIAKEGSLPVQTLSRADIEQSGVQNVADLVAQLPSMQGFITSSASVNGGGGGVQTASIHAIGTQYTLVLLNGRRMAPYGTGSAVNLASIPLSAVERVEILTDGASTLYGSDAIAGVINFILKKNQTDLVVEGTYNSPQEKGGKSSNFSISKGWGNLDSDGFNVQVSYAHDEQKELNASDRDFAKSGVHKFSHKGKQYATWQTSINSTPANVEVVTADDDVVLNHDLLTKNGCTQANTFSRSGACRFDYAATVQLLPELKRDSVFANGTLKLGKDTTAYSELVLSKFTNTARYAPAAQPLTVFSTDPVSGVKTVNNAYMGAYNSSIVPLLASQGVNAADVTDALLYYRGADAGGRTDEYRTDAVHFVVGVDSNISGWDVGASYTHSQNKQTDKALAGYMSANKFEELIRTGKYNPFVSTTGAAALLADAVLHQDLDVTKSKIDVISAKASREVFDLPGGAAALGLGADFTKQTYTDTPAAIAMGPNPGNPGWTDVEIGGGTGSQALDASRKNWGAFAELLMPVAKTLETTAAVRYDSYDAVEKNNVSYDPSGKAAPSGKLGEDVAKATYKLSARWTPVQSLLVRGSYGTGFKAPTLNNIADPLKNAGSSNAFPCPVKSPDPRAVYCRPGSSEYGLLDTGNPNTGDKALKAETSKQATLGFRVEPTTSLSVGLDWWDVKLKNQIRTYSQDQLYGVPALANQYIAVYADPIQKSNVLVAIRQPLNLASSHFQGLDWDTTFRTATPIGKASVNWTGTYMLKAEQETPGVGTEKSIGRFDSYDDVVFRVVSRLIFTLKTSDKLSNSLTVNYRSGYHDKPLTADDAAVRVVNADGTIGGVVAMEDHDVSSYTTLDWQTKLNYVKNLTITAGIRNLLDRDPPFSIRNSGGGNQVGYDGRYADPLGRTFYITAQYRF